MGQVGGEQSGHEKWSYSVTKASGRPFSLCAAASRWIVPYLSITYTEANQSTRKALFTCVVYTNCWHQVLFYCLLYLVQLRPPIFSLSASLRETEPHRKSNVYNSLLVVACLENVMITLFSLFIWNLQVRFIEHIWLLQYRPVRCVCVYRKIHYLARVFHSNQIWVSARAFVALIDLNITDRFSEC